MPSIDRLLRRALPALLALALAACDGMQDESRRTAEAPAEPAPAEAAEPAEAPAPEAAAPEEPSGTVVARTLTRDGEVFEAEYGKEGQLPTDFPDDVPLYRNARPLSSLAAPDRGTVVNLRSSDTPEQMFAWYQQQYAEQGWEIEHAKQEHARSTIVARKGNRVSSVVILGVPGATQALLTVAEDR